MRISKFRLLILGAATIALAADASASMFISNTTVRFFPCNGNLGVFAAAQGSSNVAVVFTWVPNGSASLPSDTTLTGASISVSDTGEISVWNSSSALTLDLDMYGSADSSASAFHDDGGLALHERRPALGTNFGAISQSSPCDLASDPVAGSTPCDQAGCTGGGCGADGCGSACTGSGPQCSVHCRSGYYACCKCGTSGPTCNCNSST